MRWLAIASLQLLARVAQADATLPSPVERGALCPLAPPTPDACSAASLGAARDAYHRGTAAFELGHHEEASAAFVEAHRHCPNPLVIYNIARSEQLAGHKAVAVACYRRFLAAPSAAGTRRDDAESRIRELEATPSPPPLERLNRGDILGGLATVRDQTTECRRQHRVEGVAVVELTIDRDGTPSAARTVAPHADTAVGRCLESAVRRARFPRFSSEPLTVKYPFPPPAAPATSKGEDGARR